MSRPASNSLCMFSSDQQAGPIVQMILVRRSEWVSLVILFKLMRVARWFTVPGRRIGTPKMVMAIVVIVGGGANGDYFVE